MFSVGQRVLLVYAAGDCDEVEILSLNGDGSSFEDSAEVRLPDGRICLTLQEDLVGTFGPDDEFDL